MVIRTAWVSILVLLLSSLPAQAQDDDKRGGYIAAGIGSTWFDDDNKLGDRDLDDNDVGWTLFGGYRFFRFFAVEAGYTNFGKYKAEGVFNDTEEKFQALYLAGVGILPLGDSFQLSGKLGGGALQLDQSFSNQPDADDRGSTLLVGVGAQWAPSGLKGVAFNLNLDGYFFTVEQANVDYDQRLALLSVGVQYNF